MPLSRFKLPKIFSKRSPELAGPPPAGDAPPVEDGPGTAAGAGDGQANLGTVERRAGPNGPQSAARRGRNVHSIGATGADEPLRQRGMPRTAIGHRPAAVPRSDGQAGQPANHAAKSLFGAAVCGPR